MNEPNPVPTAAPLTVLVVEDDPSLSLMACSILRRAGYGVTQAGSAEEAAEVLEGEHDVALVFSDFVLPGRTGLELVASIGAGGPSVLVTTGQRAPAVRAEIEAAGHPFLPKPYTAQELLAATRAAIGDPRP